MAFKASTQAHANDNHGSNTMVINVPTNQDGDMLVLVWSATAGFTGHGGSATDPAGWTVVTAGNANITGTGSDTFVYSRIAASEPASYTLDAGTAGGQMAVMLSYSNTTLDATQFAAQDAHTVSDDKTGAASSTGAQGADNVFLYLPIYYITAYDYPSLTDGGATVAVTPVTPAINTRELVLKSDTEPANATRDGMLWVGDTDPLTYALEPSWNVGWTWQPNPPNSIGVRWTFVQAWFLLTSAGGASGSTGAPGDGGPGGTTDGGAGGNRQGDYFVRTALQQPKRRKVQITVLPHQLNDQMLRE